MKLGLVIYGSLDSLSGGYLYDRKLVNNLTRLGDTVDVISLPPGQPTRAGWLNYVRHLGDNLSQGLSRRLERLEVDILLQDELNHPSLAWINRRLRGRVAYPVVSIVHHLRSDELRPAWQNRFYAWVERIYLKSVDGFIYNSRTTQGRVERLAGKGLPSVVAYPAANHLNPQIEQVEIIQRARQAGPLSLFFVGNLIPRKGLHTVLEALSHLPKGEFTLEVAGSLTSDPVYVDAIRQQIEKLNLSLAVHLHGALGDSQLVDNYRRAQVLVLPSSYEGFGIAYLEGMGFGLPCIGTTAGAAGEVIEEGQTGLLIPPGDSVSLANHLRRLADDRTLLETMSLAARRRYLSHPTWEQTAEKTRSFLQTFI